MGSLFGTDGARGIANASLGCETALGIGRAAAVVLTRHLARRARVVIGQDPRASSDMLTAALAAGLCSVGADVLLLGVVPTPAAAYLTSRYGADAGAMVSASHNPAEYNGIKLFSAEGRKLPDAVEDEIETVIAAGSWTLAAPGAVGSVPRARDAAGDYADHLCASVDADLLGMKIAGAPSPLRVAVDCANGSASFTAPRMFAALGLACEFLHAEPDGANINDRCGSTSLGSLSEYVVSHGCDVGFAFDGDADRCLAVDETGAALDGDRIIGLIARDMKSRGTLKNGAVVTVMSNLGFFRFCERCGIPTATTRVGDRYVLEEMLRAGHNIGGEQSGHIILSDDMPTGDGELTALRFLEVYRRAMLRGERSLHRLASEVTLYPQMLVNVTASDARKGAFGADPSLGGFIPEREALLGGDGRVLVRVSGTEALIRVMAEGPDPACIAAVAEAVAARIRLLPD